MKIMKGNIRDMVKGDDIVESRRVEESKTKLSAASRIYPGMQVTGVAIQEVESLNFSESFRQSFVFLVFQLHLHSFDLKSFNEKTPSRSRQSFKVSLLQ